MIYCDAHIHIQNCTDTSFIHYINLHANKYMVCSCAHSKIEWERLCSIAGEKIYKSFGIHPQICVNRASGSAEVLENRLFLKNLLESHKIDAIGEVGFDLYSSDLKQTQKQQEEIWFEQLELAQKYEKVLIIHNRKAMHLLFRDSKMLKKVPAVIMHSYPGSLIEIKSFLSQGINAYFSFGKQILNNNKNAIKCASLMDSNRLLLETDAPYQTLKYEKETRPSDILRVYKKTAELRQISELELSNQIAANFIKCFESL